MSKVGPEADREERCTSEELQLVAHEAKTEVAEEALRRALELLARWALRRGRKG